MPCLGESFGLRLSNKPLADEVVFFAINVEIDAIAK